MILSVQTLVGSDGSRIEITKPGPRKTISDPNNKSVNQCTGHAEASER